MNNLDQINKIMKELHDKISISLAPIQLFNLQFQAQMEALTEPFKRMQLLSQSIAQSLKPLTEIAKNFDFKGWEEFLKEFGWIEAISMSYASELKDKLKASGKEEVWKQLISDFEDDKLLNELISKVRTDKIIKAREKILEKAIQHHKNKDYISSIPLLLSQIEGILWDIGINQGLIENKFNSKNLIDVKGNLILGKNGKPIECSLGELIIKIFNNSSKFGEHTKSNVYSKDFRHPILHGREINYDNEQRSTMLLLMLFVLIEKDK
ncbi:MAG: hypothetical protein JW716_03905 [Candidatus Aenigmarchaeota archaeon]|nr:hypothetical protein [Candidatus Aenigmarchaeota archaeon]